MALETAAREAISITKRLTRTAEQLTKKAWSVADAASEKKAPGDYLSPNAIKSIQGHNKG